MPIDRIEKIVFLLNKEQLVDAEKQIIQLIQKNPNNYAYKNLLSITYAKQNKIDLSIKILYKIIRIVTMATIYLKIMKLMNY